jgi:hypothetical protein
MLVKIVFVEMYHMDFFPIELCVEHKEEKYIMLNTSWRPPETTGMGSSSAYADI